MSIAIIQERLQTYKALNKAEEINALKEISQEIALLGLSRAGFFNKAAFQGGTSLRILYGLPRFSEDLDFILLEPDLNFVWETYFDALKENFEAFGLSLEVHDRSKAHESVKKAFIKEHSFGKVLSLTHPRTRGDAQKLRIKFEVDTNPPAGSQFKPQILTFPSPCSITVQDLPSLFAGKLHALLCREYVKGRDWFDYIWYISRKTTVNFGYLEAAIFQMGPWESQKLKVDKDWLLEKMREKIKSLNFDQAKNDIARFLPEREKQTLDLWNSEYL